MVGKTIPPTVEERARMHFIRYAGGCLPCLIRGFPNGHATIQHVVEGRKRKGHRFTYGGCIWHHLGTCRDGLGQRAMMSCYGPSLYYTPADYHDTFGSELELVALQDKMIELYDADPWPDFDMPMYVVNRLRRFYIEQRAVG